ncbi:MAG: hypothetical protein ONB46_04065 [candidate division KSB1 bacterium]|nr:hypothetical protein [candidate division KSB1 bacterium]MDZ7365205.1 hypothetical protein [candidate division KSB1 bacterium]MDZ7406953.1 hypothetical protein [candidate division KSB1 bacterium]
MKCHTGIESMHKSPAVKLGCTDCHGGNAEARTRGQAHVKPRHERRWPSAANPARTYTLLNDETPDFIRFVNPGDLRVVDQTCAPCHAQEVLNVKKSMMTTSALLWGGAAYNNGIISAKNYILGESYSRDGEPQMINTVPPPTLADLKKGVLPFLVPLPRWEISQPGDYFRSFERGGRIARGNPSEIGIPNILDEPGRPDNKLSARGLGTELLISSPVLNLQKTRLNDPNLSFLGTNDHPGDYRSSGCTACHVVYANDRSPVHSGPYAKFGNRGFAQTADEAIPKKESGHPIMHQFTKAIPSSQCMVCHMHQPNGFLNTFFGFQMWDYESDGKWMYPEKQKYPSVAEAFELLAANPEEAVLRGNWGDPNFLRTVTRLNPKLKRTQFADYHGHGWIFRAVFKKDRKGNLLDKDGKIISPDSPHTFHGVVPLEGSEGDIEDEACRNAQKAVHLKDIHAEKGMHCVDCHYEQDNHGNGKLYGEFHNAIEIQCVDCHGTVTERATLRTSGLAAPEGGTNLLERFTPFKEKQFSKKGNRIFQRSMLNDTLQWEIPQVVDIVDPSSKYFNSKARAAKLVAKGGGEWASPMAKSLLAHSPEKMECYSCHSSWVTNCFGCHLPQQANWKKEMNHYEGEKSRNWTTYNPQVLRDDGFMLCVNGTTKGNKVAPARSSSALLLSSRNANREQIYNQQAPISAPGYSSQAFNPHFPHTVRKTETRSCTDCHLSDKNDNNAWMAQVLLQGTNFVNFMGKYAYVATGRNGFEAVQVTEQDEPQAVIGSYLHKLAYPDYYKKHLFRGRKLKTAYHHGGTNIQSLQLRGEYLYTANGEDGFRVYDVANVDNKGFSERVISAPVSPLGQDTQVKTKYATAVALPTNMPIDTKRVHRPENQEQWPIHPLYSYAYITDKYEGLILVEVMTLVDNDPRNNFLQRAVTFNPKGILNGATNLTIAGNYVYITCDAGLVIVSIADPLKPRVVGGVGAPKIKKPKAVAVQFRYSFVCDVEGVKVVDVTFPEKPKFVSNSFVPLKEANNIYVARTYAYVAAGAQGLVIIDAENPEALKIEQIYTAKSQINDARDVKVAATNASVFAYLADGRNGLRVIQLTSPENPNYLGFSPRPTPKLIATHKTHGEALAISKGLDRDRAVDESGNQVSVFGRLGSRPFTLVEQQKLYLRNGKIWTVSDEKMTTQLETMRSEAKPPSSNK